VEGGWREARGRLEGGWKEGRTRSAKIEARVKAITSSAFFFSGYPISTTFFPGSETFLSVPVGSGVSVASLPSD
jgi:hypothetical protein